MMRGAAPPLTIGMPVHNGADLMGAALDSLLAQDYVDFELIISDNGSTDATREIAEDYARRDPRVTYDRLPENRGAAVNYSRLVDLARGRWFKWASHDDLHAREYVGRCVEVLESDPRVVLAYCRTMLIDANGTPVRAHEDRLHLDMEAPWRRVAALARRWGLCNPVFGVIDRARLRRTGLIRPSISSDVVLLAELAMLGRFHEVPDRAFLRRIHARSSRQGDLSMEEVAEWFDPQASGRVSSSPTRLVPQVARAAFDLAGPYQGAACSLAYGGTWSYRRTRVLLGRWRRSLPGGRTR